MKREAAPSYKRVMRELYGDFMHPDFDRAGGTSPEEHKAMVRLSHRVSRVRMRDRMREARQASAEKRRPEELSRMAGI